MNPLWLIAIVPLNVALGLWIGIGVGFKMGLSRGTRISKAALGIK